MFDPLLLHFLQMSPKKSSLVNDSLEADSPISNAICQSIQLGQARQEKKRKEKSEEHFHGDREWLVQGRTHRSTTARLEFKN